MAFVVDCSVTMAWCFADEANPYVESVLELLRQEDAMVPAIWTLEVANVLLIAERRRRLTEAQTVRFAQLLQTLPITVDDQVGARLLGPVMAIGRRQGLSAYDASYLELAAREALPLATQDANLRAAAARIGVLLI